tara:strand:+ start:99 stop:704 length:606 start_codon:yes stop_codon:yes gene_type:complete
LYIVGLTGGIGSGKSEATKIFKGLAVPIIDLDDIAHEITQKDCPGYIGITKFFGAKYLDKNNEIIRSDLRYDIFKDPEIKKRIESILHPIIFNECKKKISQYKSDEYIVIVIPLLFETKVYLELIDESLLIDCDEKKQFKRVGERDKINSDLINSIIKTQLSRDYKNKLSSKIINNDSNLLSLESKIHRYHIELRTKINGR